MVGEPRVHPKSSKHPPPQSKARCARSKAQSAPAAALGSAHGVESAGENFESGFGVWKEPLLCLGGAFASARLPFLAGLTEQNLLTSSLGCGFLSDLACLINFPCLRWLIISSGAAKTVSSSRQEQGEEAVEVLDDAQLKAGASSSHRPPLLIRGWDVLGVGTALGLEPGCPFPPFILRVFITPHSPQRTQGSGQSEPQQESKSPLVKYVRCIWTPLGAGEPSAQTCPVLPD